MSQKETLTPSSSSATIGGVREVADRRRRHQYSVPELPEWLDEPGFIWPPASVESIREFTFDSTEIEPLMNLAMPPPQRERRATQNAGGQDDAEERNRTRATGSPVAADAEEEEFEEVEEFEEGDESSSGSSTETRGDDDDDDNNNDDSTVFELDETAADPFALVQKMAVDERGMAINPDKQPGEINPREQQPQQQPSPKLKFIDVDEAVAALPPPTRMIIRRRRKVKPPPPPPPRLVFVPHTEQRPVEPQFLSMPKDLYDTVPQGAAAEHPFRWCIQFSEAIAGPSGQDRDHRIAVLAASFCEVAVPVAMFVATACSTLPTGVSRIHRRGVTYEIPSRSESLEAVANDTRKAIRGVATDLEYRARAILLEQRPIRGLVVPFTISVHFLGVTVLCSPRIPVDICSERPVYGYSSVDRKQRTLTKLETATYFANTSEQLRCRQQQQQQREHKESHRDVQAAQVAAEAAEFFSNAPHTVITCDYHVETIHAPALCTIFRSPLDNKLYMNRARTLCPANTAFDSRRASFLTPEFVCNERTHLNQRLNPDHRATFVFQIDLYHAQLKELRAKKEELQRQQRELERQAAQLAAHQHVVGPDSEAIGSSSNNNNQRRGSVSPSSRKRCRSSSPTLLLHKKSSMSLSSSAPSAQQQPSSHQGAAAPSLSLEEEYDTLRRAINAATGGIARDGVTSTDGVEDARARAAMKRLVFYALEQFARQLLRDVRLGAVGGAELIGGGLQHALRQWGFSLSELPLLIDLVEEGTWRGAHTRQLAMELLVAEMAATAMAADTMEGAMPDDMDEDDLCCANRANLESIVRETIQDEIVVDDVCSPNSNTLSSNNSNRNGNDEKMHVPKRILPVVMSMDRWAYAKTFAFIAEDQEQQSQQHATDSGESSGGEGEASAASPDEEEEQPLVLSGGLSNVLEGMMMAMSEEALQQQQEQEQALRRRSSSTRSSLARQGSVTGSKLAAAFAKLRRNPLDRRRLNVNQAYNVERALVYAKFLRDDLWIPRYFEMLGVRVSRDGVRITPSRGGVRSTDKFSFWPIVLVPRVCSRSAYGDEGEAAFLCRIAKASIVSLASDSQFHGKQHQHQQQQQQQQQQISRGLIAGVSVPILMEQYFAYLQANEADCVPALRNAVEQIKDYHARPDSGVSANATAASAGATRAVNATISAQIEVLKRQSAETAALLMQVRGHIGDNVQLCFHRSAANATTINAYAIAAIKAIHFDHSQRQQRQRSRAMISMLASSSSSLGAPPPICEEVYSLTGTRGRRLILEPLLDPSSGTLEIPVPERQQAPSPSTSISASASASSAASPTSSTGVATAVSVYDSLVLSYGWVPLGRATFSTTTQKNMPRTWLKAMSMSVERPMVVLTQAGYRILDTALASRFHPLSAPGVVWLFSAGPRIGRLVTVRGVWRTELFVQEPCGSVEALQHEPTTEDIVRVHQPLRLGCISEMPDDTDESRAYHLGGYYDIVAGIARMARFSLRPRQTVVFRAGPHRGREGIVIGCEASAARELAVLLIEPRSRRMERGVVFLGSDMQAIEEGHSPAVRGVWTLRLPYTREQLHQAHCVSFAPYLAREEADAAVVDYVAHNDFGKLQKRDESKASMRPRTNIISGSNSDKNQVYDAAFTPLVDLNFDVGHGEPVVMARSAGATIRVCGLLVGQRAKVTAGLYFGHVGTISGVSSRAASRWRSKQQKLPSDTRATTLSSNSNSNDINNNSLVAGNDRDEHDLKCIWVELDGDSESLLPCGVLPFRRACLAVIGDTFLVLKNETNNNNHNSSAKDTSKRMLTPCGVPIPVDFSLATMQDFGLCHGQIVHARHSALAYTPDEARFDSERRYHEEAEDDMENDVLVPVCIIGTFACELWAQVEGEVVVRPLLGSTGFHLRCESFLGCHIPVVGFSIPSAWGDALSGDVALRSTLVEERSISEPQRPRLPVLDFILAPAFLAPSPIGADSSMIARGTRLHHHQHQNAATATASALKVMRDTSDHSAGEQDHNSDENGDEWFATRHRLQLERQQIEAVNNFNCGAIGNELSVNSSEGGLLDQDGTVSFSQMATFAPLEAPMNDDDDTNNRHINTNRNIKNSGMNAEKGGGVEGTLVVDPALLLVCRIGLDARTAVMRATVQGVPSAWYVGGTLIPQEMADDVPCDHVRNPVRIVGFHEGTLYVSSISALPGSDRRSAVAVALDPSDFRTWLSRERAQELAPRKIPASVVHHDAEFRRLARTLYPFTLKMSFLGNNNDDDDDDDDDGDDDDAAASNSNSLHHQGATTRQRASHHARENSAAAAKTKSGTEKNQQPQQQKSNNSHNEGFLAIKQSYEELHRIGLDGPLIVGELPFCYVEIDAVQRYRKKLRRQHQMRLQQEQQEQQLAKQDSVLGEASPSSTAFFDASMTFRPSDDVMNAGFGALNGGGAGDDMIKNLFDQQAYLQAVPIYCTSHAALLAAERCRMSQSRGVVADPQSDVRLEYNGSEGTLFTPRKQQQQQQQQQHHGSLKVRWFPVSTLERACAKWTGTDLHRLSPVSFEMFRHMFLDECKKQQQPQQQYVSPSGANAEKSSRSAKSGIFTATGSTPGGGGSGSPDVSPVSQSLSAARAAGSGGRVRTITFLGHEDVLGATVAESDSDESGGGGGDGDEFDFDDNDDAGDHDGSGHGLMLLSAESSNNNNNISSASSLPRKRRQRRRRQQQQTETDAQLRAAARNEVEHNQSPLYENVSNFVSAGEVRFLDSPATLICVDEGVARGCIERAKTLAKSLTVQLSVWSDLLMAGNNMGAAANCSSSACSPPPKRLLRDGPQSPQQQPQQLQQPYVTDEQVKNTMQRLVPVSMLPYEAEIELKKLIATFGVTVPSRGRFASAPPAVGSANAVSKSHAEITARVWQLARVITVAERRLGTVLSSLSLFPPAMLRRSVRLTAFVAPDSDSADSSSFSISRTAASMKPQERSQLQLQQQQSMSMSRKKSVGRRASVAAAAALVAASNANRRRRSSVRNLRFVGADSFCADDDLEASSYNLTAPLVSTTASLARASSLRKSSHINSSHSVLSAFDHNNPMMAVRLYTSACMMDPAMAVATKTLPPTRRISLASVLLQPTAGAVPSAFEQTRKMQRVRELSSFAASACSDHGDREETARNRRNSSSNNNNKNNNEKEESSLNEENAARQARRGTDVPLSSAECLDTYRYVTSDLGVVTLSPNPPVPLPAGTPPSVASWRRGTVLRYTKGDFSGVTAVVLGWDDDICFRRELPPLSNAPPTSLLHSCFQGQALRLRGDITCSAYGATVAPDLEAPAVLPTADDNFHWMCFDGVWRRFDISEAVCAGRYGVSFGARIRLTQPVSKFTLRRRSAKSTRESAVTIIEKDDEVGAEKRNDENDSGDASNDGSAIGPALVEMEQPEELCYGGGLSYFHGETNLVLVVLGVLTPASAASSPATASSEYLGRGGPDGGLWVCADYTGAFPLFHRNSRSQEIPPFVTLYHGGVATLTHSSARSSFPCVTRSRLLFPDVPGSISRMSSGVTAAEASMMFPLRTRGWTAASSSSSTSTTAASSSGGARGRSPPSPSSSSLSFSSAPDATKIPESNAMTTDLFFDTNPHSVARFCLETGIQAQVTAAETGAAQTPADVVAASRSTRFQTPQHQQREQTDGGSSSSSNNNSGGSIILTKFSIIPGRRLVVLSGPMSGQRVTMVGVRLGALYVQKENETVAVPLPATLPSRNSYKGLQVLVTSSDSVALPTSLLPMKWSEHIADAARFSEAATTVRTWFRFVISTGVCCEFDITASALEPFGVKHGDVITYRHSVSSSTTHTAATGEDDGSGSAPHRTQQQLLGLPPHVAPAAVIGTREGWLWVVDVPLEKISVSSPPAAGGGGGEKGGYPVISVVGGGILDAASGPMKATALFGCRDLDSLIQNFAFRTAGTSVVNVQLASLT